MGKTELMNNRWVRSAAFLFQWRESAQSSWIQPGRCTETKDPSYGFSIWTSPSRTGTVAQDHPGHRVPWGHSVQHPAGRVSSDHWSWGCIRADMLLWRGGFSVPRAFHPHLLLSTWIVPTVLTKWKHSLPDWEVKCFHKHFQELSLPLLSDVQDLW